MADKDLVIRFLADRHLPDLLEGLWADLAARVAALERMPTELKVVTERLPDAVYRARIDGADLLLHIEFQSFVDPRLPYRILEYQALLRAAHELPVRSLVVYLLPQAPPGELPDRLETSPDEQLQLRFDVFKPWEAKIAWELLDQRPALAPIAILTQSISAAQLPRLRRCILRAQQLSHEEKLDCLAFTRVLGSGKFSAELLDSIVRSEEMEQFPEYQRIVEIGRQEGRQEGLEQGRRALAAMAIRLLSQKQPDLDEQTLTRVNRAPLALLEQLVEALLEGADVADQLDVLAKRS
jgi:predicted transposase YdaD